MAMPFSLRCSMLATTAAAAFAAALPSQAAVPAPVAASGGKWPMNYWSSAGPQAQQIDSLLWGLIWLSIVVVAIITVLVVAGILVRGKRGRQIAPADVERPRGGAWFIYVGVGISTVVLVAYTGWTVATMAGISNPPAKPAFTIEVVAHQWWWQFRYDDGNPSQIFDTANEIHIPVGQPVRFTLRSADVIHSFWIPALGGKTDVIPGRVNQMWLEAAKPGVYRGQCSEYCGAEHAEMALRIIADPPNVFAAWRSNQLADTPSPTNDLTTVGEQRFELRCGACHAVRGTLADGALGPDLSHLMTRTTIAAGMLPNTPANLAGWIADPQGIKPGALMPNIELSGPELNAIEAYLTTLD
jgi:cytochrome c oxidase subunit 2